ncbi:MAG: 6-phosphogluconolactonase [Methylococcales bacterium]
MENNVDWQQFAIPDLIEQAVCKRILVLAKDAIAARGQFKLVLAGGKTPERMYRLLATSDVDWSKWFIYHGDERVLSVDHVDRNSVMAANAFLNDVPIPKAHIFDIPTELGIEESAAAYRLIVEAAMPFDLVLLGMGEDGHTASLFPNHVHDDEIDDLIHTVYNAPKSPSERVTLSAKALSNTHCCFFLIEGVNKRDAIKQWRAGGNLPVASIRALQNLVVFIDKTAVDVD